ncbi:early endosome antigen 1-like [Dorcoceras hygrometricum]|uniref:Early endosome antigen 1-like n=1 Tax=Dorcoceras hygrometricum TaxID=472368 RepID=A0A2Z7BIX1_9LAMI|nr:early endosome antigen 1-like [Dorcoceras hygrometricum]
MSIDDLLKRIPGDMILPSILAAKPTKIKFGLGISIPGVANGDLYKASLPKIALVDKGKAPLVKASVVKGHPAHEMVDLIFGDIEFLIHLRENVIDEVSAFYHSFSLRRLAVLQSLNKDIAAKEENVLTWAETDSVQVALQRKVYILAKYREMLLRKFLESHRENFGPGQPWSVMVLQIIDLLSVALRNAVKHLLMKKQALELQWTRQCCSMLFECTFDRGFYIPKNHKIIISTCWIRLLRRIGDVWVVEDGYDRWLETTFLDALYHQNQAFHSLITGIRQEAHNDTNSLSLGLKAVRTQTAILSTDQADARKEAKEQKAIIEDMDERLATLRSGQLDFRAHAQENYNNLSSQLGELVAYINRGNDKKGEGSSSRRPQPPPDDQNRPSWGNASRGGGGGGYVGSGLRDDRKDSSTKKGSGSSGTGVPYKKNAEWWLYGKNQF